MNYTNTHWHTLTPRTVPLASLRGLPVWQMDEARFPPLWQTDTLGIHGKVMFVCVLEWSFIRPSHSDYNKLNSHFTYIPRWGEAVSSEQCEHAEVSRAASGGWTSIWATDCYETRVSEGHLQQSFMVSGRHWGTGGRHGTHTVFNLSTTCGRWRRGGGETGELKRKMVKVHWQVFFIMADVVFSELGHHSYP